MSLQLENEPNRQSLSPVSRSNQLGNTETTLVAAAKEDDAIASRNWWSCTNRNFVG
jgi:hypothetical protein